MADEGANPAGTATEPRDAPADEHGTAIEQAEAAPPARAEPQPPMLPGEVRPHPTPQRYVMIAAILAVAYPSWHAHVDVWLLVAALAASYAVVVVRVGPRYAAPGRAPVTRLQAVCFALGVLAIWVAADWPIHDIAERYNYSIHMVQHLVLSMVAAPLLLLGTPAWMLRVILRPPSLLFRAARFCA